MTGPYETEREARAAAEAATGGEHGTAANFAILASAIEAAGIEMGTWDWRVVNWLAGWERSTVAVIAGLIARANHPAGSIALSPERAETVRLALDDAKWGRVGKGVGCPDCDAVEETSRAPDDLPACERHRPDVMRAERYDEMGRWLARAAGLPVDDEPEVPR